MQVRWFLSPFFTDEETNQLIPVCAAYGARYICPRHPDPPSGVALVQMLCDVHQVEAAQLDSRLVLLPELQDLTPVPQQVIDAYSSWGAVAEMTLAQLLSMLSKQELAFSKKLQAPN